MDALRMVDRHVRRRSTANQCEFGSFAEAAAHEWIWRCGLRLLIIPAYIGESLHVGHGISPAVEVDCFCTMSGTQGSKQAE